MTTNLSWRWDGDGFLVHDEADASRERCYWLKDVLFRFHQASFYGTMMQVKLVKHQFYVYIPALHAATYFADRQQHDERFVWHGSSEQAWLHEVAAWLLDVLAGGRYAPDFSAWKNGSWQMALQMNGDEVVQYERFAETGERSIIKDWFAALFEQLNEEAHIAPVWQELAEHFSLVPSKSNNKSKQTPLFEDIHDEQEWLAAIGWNGERMSAGLGLKLLEPNADSDEEWLLVPVFRRFLRAEWESFVALQDGLTLDCSEEQRQALLERFIGAHEQWKTCIPPLAEVAASVSGYRLTDEQAWQFLTDWSRQLTDFGVAVLTPEWWQTRTRPVARLKGSQTANTELPEASRFGLQQLVQFDWRIAIDDGVELSESEFYHLVDQKKRWIRVNGRWYVMDHDWIAKISEWLETNRRQGGMTMAEVLRAMAQEQGAGDDAHEGAQGVSFAANHEEVGHSLRLSEQYRQYFRALFDRQAIEAMPQPQMFDGTLYEYQRFGFSWLLFLRKLGFGACLADDMGLGKTIQLISYLLEVQAHYEQAGEGRKPSLLVCPYSVLGNWQHELSVFAPTLKVVVHHGVDRARGEAFAEAIADADVVLTTYSLISPDFAEFQSVDWDLLCIDEAQNIKNPNVKQSKAVRKLQANHRIAMTGTPIENHLNELWSIYDFINPEYLGSLPYFRREYVSSVDKQAQEAARERLRALVYPFMLRREKKDPQVMLALPEKHEVKVFVQMTAEQTALYEGAREQLVQETGSTAKRLQMGAVLKAITRYKQICNHPSLVDRATTSGTDATSNKLLRLLEMVEEIYERGEQTLIFTQYVEMGKIIVRELKRRFPARDVLYFDGSVSGKQRQQMIDDFQKQTSRIPVMVLTIRSGGVGINLTAANHVIHYDRWWNPAVENQATDRVYRIGQTKDVTVYKLITVGTIEEKIDRLLSEKSELSDYMLYHDDEQMMRKLTVREWERLLL